MAARSRERHLLETSFLRVRWAAAVALAVLAIASGGEVLLLPTAALIAGNLGLWQLGRRVTSLMAQRRLGVGAVALDGTVAWSIVVLAPEPLVPSVHVTFVMVAVEAAVRFAPAKGLAVALGLVGVQAAAMALRRDGLDPALLGFWGAVVLLVGTGAGTAVREVYRQQARPRLGLESMQLDRSLLALLTPREREVLTLISQGASNAHIAETLVIERKTVKNHINNIYSKLHLNNRYEAIARSLRQREDAQPREPARL